MFFHDFMSPLISFFLCFMSLLLRYFTSVVRCIPRYQCILFFNYFTLALLERFLTHLQKFELKWSPVAHRKWHYLKGLAYACHVEGSLSSLLSLQVAYKMGQRIPSSFSSTMSVCVPPIPHVRTTMNYKPGQFECFSL